MFYYIFRHRRYCDVNAIVLRASADCLAQKNSFGNLHFARIELKRKTDCRCCADAFDVFARPHRSPPCKIFWCFLSKQKNGIKWTEKRSVQTAVSYSIGMTWIINFCAVSLVRQTEPYELNRNQTERNAVNGDESLCKLCAHSFIFLFSPALFFVCVWGKQSERQNEEWNKRSV